MTFNLADLFEIVVDTIPDREALICGERRLTYRQLDERANRLAHHFLAHGVGPNDHIATYLYNGTEYLETTLAAYKIRAVPINVNYRYVESELRYLFDDADIVAAVYHQSLGPRLQAAGLTDLTCLVRVADDSGEPPVAGATDYEDTLASHSPLRDFAPRSPDDLYIIYTGGTTGMPKGVMWRHEDIFFAAMGGGNIMGDPIESPDELRGAVDKMAQVVMMPVPPLMHAAAGWTTFISFFAGDRVVLDHGRSFDAERIWSIAAREKANSMAIVGDAMARPLAEALAKPDAAYDLSSLRVIGSGAAILSPAVKAQLAAHCPDVMIIDSFGVSETGYQGRAVPSSGDGGPQFMVDATTNVFDDDLRPVEPGSGIVGKLARRGRIPLGYYKDAEKTRTTFVEIDGERWALPGDMATIDANGIITLLGRGSQCINSGGEKIYPEEVEAALKSHPAVFDTVVVGVLDNRWGQTVAAVVQTRDGAALALEDVQQHCRSLLAGYKVPRKLAVVDALQRQPSGKPDYRWAKATAEAHAR